MRRATETAGDDPVGAWFQRQGRAAPALRYTTRVRLPGGTLCLRTNSAVFDSYLRKRCRHLRAGAGAKAAVVAEVFCLPGQTWPVVSPHPEPRARRYAAPAGFQSCCKDGVLCTWQTPALMGCLAGANPATIRIVATTVNPRLIRRPPGGFRLKCASDSLTYSDVFDLALCLCARARGVSLLHGAVLEKGGHGVLLTGASGCGKTTSALALVRAGFRLLSDEYAVLWKRGRQRGLFSGVLVPQMLVGAPPGSLDELEQGLGTVTAAEKAEFSVRPAATRREPVAVQTVVSLVRAGQRAREHRAAPMEPRDLLPCLLSQLLDPVSSGRHDVLEVLLDVMGNARAYQVTAGTNLATLPAFIEGLQRGSPSVLEHCGQR